LEELVGELRQKLDDDSLNSMPDIDEPLKGVTTVTHPAASAADKVIAIVKPTGAVARKTVAPRWRKKQDLCEERENMLPCSNRGHNSAFAAHAFSPVSASTPLELKYGMLGELQFANGVWTRPPKTSAPPIQCRNSAEMTVEEMTSIVSTRLLFEWHIRQWS